MKATYFQRGETLDYKNSTSDAIEEGTVLPIASRIGVAGDTINPGQTGPLHVTGVYEMKKTDSGAITQGTAVYYDGTGITSADSDNIPAGYAAQDAGASAATVYVKLLG